MGTLVIIDFYNLIHRSYHAFPRTLSSSTGIQTNAIYGFFSAFLGLIKEIRPTYVVVAYETGPSFRNKKFEDYKATRTWRKEHPEEAEELDKQAELVLEILAAMRVPVVEMEKYEADDIIGTLAKKFSKKGIEVIIVSNDLDFLQLVDNNIKLYRPPRPPYVKKEIFTPRKLKEKYNFNPKQIIDYKALKGDPSDNIPGVYGVGEKGARKLILKFKSLENIYKNIEKVQPQSLREKLIKGKDSAFLSKDLATIQTDISISLNLKDAHLGNLNNKRVKELFEKYEFASLIKKLDNLSNRKEENQIKLCI